MMNKRTLLALSISLAFTAAAQNDLTMPGLRNTFQASQYNPAIMMENKLSIGLPVLSNFHITNARTGITVQDVIDSKDPSDSLLDLNTLHGKIKGDGIGINNVINYDLLHVAFRFGKNQLGIHSTLRTENNFLIGKDFLGFAFFGNEYYRGQTAEINPLSVYSLQYIENGVSLSRKIGTFTVGARAKYLQGLATARTENLGLSFTTPNNSIDPISVRTRGTLYTAGIPLLTDSVSGEDPNKKDKQFDITNLYSFQNSGFGFDFGLTYTFKEKLFFAASVMDLGGISWKKSVYTYELPGNSVEWGGYTYDIVNDSTSRTEFSDSLVSLLTDAKVTRSNFNTPLNTRVFFTTEYQFTKRDRLGVTYQGRRVLNTFQSAFAISYTHRFFRSWDLTANYSYLNESFRNVGVGTSFNLGPVQLYLVSDDILIWIKPNTQNTLYYRMGMNLVFGRPPKKKKD